MAATDVTVLASEFIVASAAAVEFTEDDVAITDGIDDNGVALDVDATDGVVTCDTAAAILASKDCCCCSTNFRVQIKQNKKWEII